MIKAIIFDCFGVLVGRGFNETYRMAGGDPVKDHEFIRDLLVRTSLGIITQNQFHDEITSKLNTSLDEYYDVVRRAELSNEELLKYIEVLHKKFKTAVLSNANAGVVERKIGKDWALRCFDVVVVSAEVNMVKPVPRIYEITAERLGVESSECVFIDDQEGFCIAARDAGMQAIVYKDFTQMKQGLENILAA